MLTVVKSSAKLAHFVYAKASKSGKIRFASAVAVLNDEVYVLRGIGGKVEVYDATSFKLLRMIAIPGFARWLHARKLCSRQGGLAVCRSNNCLYASDWNNYAVHRLDLAGVGEATRWKVGGTPVGLSVNRARNVVVACRGSNSLQEYTTDGSFVREIRLITAGVTYPWHAVELSTGNYVVSQGTKPGLVFEVDLDGRLIRSYGESPTSDAEPDPAGGQVAAARTLRHPQDIAVTKNDDLLVADSPNKRIVLVQTSTGGVQDLALAIDGGIEMPSSVCFDQSRARLYISELTGQYRLLVFAA